MLFYFNKGGVVKKIDVDTIIGIGLFIVLGILLVKSFEMLPKTGYITGAAAGLMIGMVWLEFPRVRTIFISEGETGIGFALMAVVIIIGIAIEAFIMNGPGIYLQFVLGSITGFLGGPLISRKFEQ